MLKILYFLKKAVKIAAALRAPPLNPRWPPAAGDSAPRPPNCCSHSSYVLLLSNAQISRHRWNYDVLSHTWVTESGPPSRIFSLAQTSSYATGARTDPCGMPFLRRCSLLRGPLRWWGWSYDCGQAPWWMISRACLAGCVGVCRWNRDAKQYRRLL